MLTPNPKTNNISNNIVTNLNSARDSVNNVINSINQTKQIKKDFNYETQQNLITNVSYPRFS
jgi:ethanolamine ammonia-lyase large subunit